MNEFESGKTYYGPNNERQTVTETTPRTVTLRHPMTYNFKTVSLKEMREFVKGSTRRSYVNKKGERRTKVDQTETDVFFINAEGQMEQVPVKAWDKWRSAAS